MKRPAAALENLPKKKEESDKDEKLEEDEEEEALEEKPTPKRSRMAPGERATAGPLNVGSIELKPFFPHTVPLNFIGNVLGKCGTGKSFWVRWLLFALQHRFHKTHVFTGTKLNGWYQQFVDERAIYEGYDEEIMGDIIDSCVGIRKRCEAEGKPFEYRTLIIMDDVFKDQTAIRNSKRLKDLFTVHRHYNISVITQLQTKVGLNKFQREMSAFVTMFKCTSPLAKEGLYQDYGDLLNKKEFCELLDKKAVDVYALVSRPSKNSKRITKAYESSLAEDVPDFKMAHLKFKDYMGEAPEPDQDEEERVTKKPRI